MRPDALFLAETQLGHMVDDVTERARRAFWSHGSFEPSDDAYENVTTPFDARVAVDEADGGRGRFEVTVRVPSLDAAVAEDVAPVVEDGWSVTFELRVEDVGGVTRGDDEVETEVRRTRDEIVVEMTYEDLDANRGADDANALVNFVEGTYVQGIIPGYEYTGPVSELVSNARDAAGGERA